MEAGIYSCLLKNKQIKMEARTKNFSAEEIELLLNIVDARASVIENKKTDNITSVEKDRAWKEVEIQFNSTTTGHSRTLKVLKTKYLNLKSNLKKRSSIEKRALYETGGGPPQKQEYNAFDNILKNIIPPKQIDGIVSQYDSDSVAIEPEFIEDVSVEERECTIKDSTCWESYTPGMLKSKKNEKLSLPKSPNDKKCSWKKLADVKAKWTEVKLKKEIEIIQSEHELRVAQMKELHGLQMRLLAEKHETELVQFKKIL